MLEHVPDPRMTATLARLLRPGGALFVSTSTATSDPSCWRFRRREYLHRSDPRGTHGYERLIAPAELARWARAAGLTLSAMAGIELNPFTDHVALSGNVSVNYLAHFRR